MVELHDCFSANELITYEALGLCGEGEAGQFIDAGDNTYGGKYVVNPSGGLISKGHPLGATGLAQCYELCSQVSFSKVWVWGQVGIAAESGGPMCVPAGAGRGCGQAGVRGPRGAAAQPRAGRGRGGGALQDGLPCHAAGAGCHTVTTTDIICNKRLYI